MMKPTPAALAFAKDWAARAVEAIHGTPRKHDQNIMNEVQGKTWQLCNDKAGCRAASSQVMLGHLFLIV